MLREGFYDSHFTESTGINYNNPVVSDIESILFCSDKICPGNGDGTPVKDPGEETPKVCPGA